MTEASGMMKPTSITIHSDTVSELVQLRAHLGVSYQEIMRQAIQRAGTTGMALTVPDRVLNARAQARTRRPKMLYMRAEECDALWRVQRALDLNASRAIEVCIHNTWLAYMPK